MMELITQITQNEVQQEEYTCYSCGEVIDPASLFVHEIDGQLYCEDCCTRCEFCGDYVCNEDAVYANEDLVWQSTWRACPSCANSHFETCSHCGGLVYSSGISMRDNRMVVCTACDGDYVECHECGEILRIEDSFFCNRDDEYYCEDCYRGDDSPYIGEYDNYQYDPDYSYHRRRFRTVDDEEHTEMFFGIEQEVDGGVDRAGYASELHDFSEDGYLFTMKRDGSLGDEGVEIVSCPCSYRFLMEEYPLERIWETSREYGYRSHDTNSCGLHIHVSRKAIGETRLQQDEIVAKIIVLFWRHWNEVSRFARRGYSDYAKKAEIGDCSGDSLETVVEKSRKFFHDRYMAINNTNEMTVEFRLFRGTLNARTVKASVQFVKRLIEFCQQNDISRIMDVEWKELMTTEYAELNEYLMARDLL